jgi:hypothetical protein
MASASLSAKWEINVFAFSERLAGVWMVRQRYRARGDALVAGDKASKNVFKLKNKRGSLH